MLVSVVIPCHNVEAYVADALESALAQTYRPLEIIAVDNNSADGTKEILDGYQGRYPELITVLEEARQGAPAARNCGLKQVKGEWVQFLDADDLILPEKIARQMEAVEVSDCEYIAGAAVFASLDGKQKVMIPDPDPIKGVMEGLKGGGTCSNLWKVSAIKDIGGWRESLEDAQDTDLMMRLLMNGAKVAIAKEPLTIKRERSSGQITKRNPEKHFSEHVRLRSQFLDFLEKEHLGYYRLNKKYLLLCLFLYIRMLAGINPEKAIALYKSEFPPNFRFFPDRDLRIGRFYAAMVNLLGYPKVETFKKFVTKSVRNEKLLHFLRRIIHDNPI